MIKSILKTVEPAYNHNAAGHIISMSFGKKNHRAHNGMVHCEPWEIKSSTR